MKHVLLFLFILSFWISFGQESKNQYFITSPYFHKIEEIKFKNPDKAITISDSILKNGSKKYYSDAYAALAYVDMTRFNYESALSNLKKSVMLDESNKDSIRLSRGYNLLGHYYKNKSLKDSSLYFYEKATSLLPSDQVKLLGQYYYDLTGGYGVFGEKIKYNESLKESKKYSIIAKDTLTLLLIEEKENTLFKKGLGDYTAGRNIYLYSLTTSNPYLISLSQFHYASGLANYKDSLEIAIKYNDSAFDYFKNIKDFHSLGLSSMLGASLAKRQNLKEKVISYYSDYYELLKHTNHNFKYATIYNMGTYYADNRSFDKAEEMFLEVLEESKENNIQPMLIALVHQALSGVYEETGNYAKSLDQFKKFKRIEDTLYDNRITEQINDFNTKYQTEQKEKENLQLKAENAEKEIVLAQQTKRNWQLGGGLATAILGLGIFFIAYRKNQKQKKEIEQQKNLVETLQKELHHRMKNNLAFIDLFINLAKGRFPDAAYQNKLTELQNRMRSMFEVHKQLFKKDDVTTVQAKNYIDTLVQFVQEGYGKDQNITIANKTSDDELLLANTSFPIGLIVNEFVTNSYKYAFQDNEKGHIDIALSSDDKNYLLTLKDSGKGLPDDFNIDKLDSFGLETIQLLIQEYKGTFNLDGSQGVMMKITLPKTAA